MKSHNSTIQLLIFIKVILVELSTRTLYQNIDKENVNFTEFLNDSFITTENLRNELKRFMGQLDSDHIYYKRNLRTTNEIICFIELLMAFQNKWNASYSNWLSSYKAQRTNKNSLVTGDEYLHLNYQTLYPNFKKFHWETENMMSHTKYIIELFEEYAQHLENELEWNTKSFIYKLFNTKPTIGEQP